MEPPGSWPSQEKTMSIIIRPEDVDLPLETSDARQSEMGQDTPSEDEYIPDVDVKSDRKQSLAASLPAEIIEQYVLKLLLPTSCARQAD